MQEDMCGFKSLLESLLMPFPNGENEDVISKDARDDIEGFHDGGPWAKEKCDEHHRQGATLGDATWMLVAKAEDSSYTIINSEGLHVARIRSEDSLREPPSFEQEIEQLANDLVETFEDICSSACYGFSFQDCIFHDQRNSPPCILSPIMAGASEHVVVPPRGHPSLKVVKPHGCPLPV